ncbi:MAG: VWA domain-containing protein [Anaerolineae bacterium]|nr:VWA domain-containing protein [Anaerolineae bacterium]
MKPKRWVVPVFGISTLLALLLFLAACGGSADEAVQDTGDVDTEAVEDSAESETIADDDPSATGSEDDSGEIPPTPETGSKVSPTRVSPAQLSAVATAVATAPPTNRTTTETANTSRQIDLVLVIDATGSMAPELSQLQAGLAEVATGFSTLPGAPTLRYGFVLYRDLDIGQSTQLFSLTDNWAQFAENLTAVTAVGGGDYPEDVNNGFYQAVASMNWQPEATKLMILLGDAPPHLASAAYPSLDETAVMATEHNITIYTIGSSGLGEGGIAAFQQLAQNHNGRFFYLAAMPGDVPAAVTAVYAITDLPTVLVDIVAETLNQPTR